MRKIFTLFILIIFSTSTAFTQSVVVVKEAIPNANLLRPVSVPKGIHAPAVDATKIHIAGAQEGTAWTKKLSEQCSGMNFVYCAMAVLSAVQVGMSIADALKSKKTADASKCVGAYCDSSGSNNSLGTTGPTGGSFATGTLSPSPDEEILGRIQKDVNSQLASLAKDGYTYDSKTNSVNTPNGNVPASALGSAEGLKSLGMTDADLNKLEKIQDAVRQELQKKSGKYAGSDSFDGAGGGGSSSKPGPGYDDKDKRFDMNAYLAGLSKKDGANRGVAGLEKKYGSDQIGVAGDDIFKMIHRRYQAKKPSLSP